MQTRQLVIDTPSIDHARLDPLAELAPQLILLFGSVEFFTDAAFMETLQARFPDTPLAGCSTAGEICGEGVMEGSAVITALRFEAGTRVEVADAEVASMADSEAAGAALGRVLRGDALKALLLFGKGVEINGSALIEGVTREVGGSVPVTGGLGGDNGAFTATYTLSPAGVSAHGAVAVGLYGEALTVGHGSFGGWSSFGPPRKVTRSDGNILYELDDTPALQIYKDYLGEYAKDLPSSGLLFPFEMLREDHSTVGLIRTILGIDEQQGSLILAGDIDPDGYLRLMHASTDGLVDGAEEAAKRTLAGLPEGASDGLAILVSCVGRKLVMGDQVDEEVEAVAEVLGESATLTGFYSYGEISPFSATTDCKLHNQTMTVTFIGEHS